MVRSLDFNLNAMGSHWKILSRKVMRIDLHLHKMFRSNVSRWCKPEEWLGEPHVPLYLANLFTCPDLVPENSIQTQVLPRQTSHWVCRSYSLNTAMGTKPPPKGAFSLHLILLQRDSAPAPFLQLVHLNGSRSASCPCSCRAVVCLVGACLPRLLTW